MAAQASPHRCRWCNGTGVVAERPVLRCAACDGDGTLKPSHSDPLAGYDGYSDAAENHDGVS